MGGFGSLIQGLTGVRTAQRQGRRERDQYEAQALREALQRRLMEAQIGNYQAQARQRERPESAAARAPTTVWSDQGLMQYDDDTQQWRPAPTRTGAIRQREPPEPRVPNVTSPEGLRIPDIAGAQVAPPGGMGSASVLNAIKENQTKLSVIDSALAQLETRPKGVGLKGLIPDVALQRVDPKGVNLRADISDIGSMVIHDRSGAAVSAREMPRLSPFIPKVSDTPDAVRRKLARMKEIIREETAFLDRNRQRSGATRQSLEREGPQGPAPSPGPQSIPSRFRP